MVFGGERGETRLKSVWQWNLDKNDGWEPLQNYTGDFRSSPTVVALREYVYVFGGTKLPQFGDPTQEYPVIRLNINHGLGGQWEEVPELGTLNKAPIVIPYSNQWNKPEGAAK